MALIVKPEIGKVWASTGSKSTPPDTKIASGWGYEMMPFEWENWIQNRADTAIAHINQRGIAEWDIGTEYQANRSYVTGSDGVVYKALTTNTNINPVTDSGANWRVAFVGVGVNGSVGIGTAPLPNTAVTVAGTNTSLTFGVASSDGGYGEIYANSLVAGWRANTYYNGADRASMTGYSPSIVMRLDDGSIRFSTSVNTTINAPVVWTERMHIDRNGSIGVGVVPSVGYGKEISLSADVLAGVAGVGVRNYAINNSELYLTNNAKNTGHGSDAYWTGLQYATKYKQGGGAHAWQIAPVGTAGGSISWTEAMRLEATGNLGIGTSSPGERLHVMTGANDTCIRLQNTASGTKTWNITAGGGGNYTPGVFAIRNVTDGTTPLLIDPSGNLGLSITPSAWGSGWRSVSINSGGGSIASSTRGIVVANNTYNNGSNWIYSENAPAALFTTDGGAFAWQIASAGVAGSPVSFQQVFGIDTSGNFLSVGGGKLGYGPGSGGTVTQTTNKNSPVTLHKPSGRITMHSAWLASGANVTFTVNNSLVAASDCVVVNISGGVAASGSYQVWAEVSDAGGIFTITLRNISGIAAADAVIVNFVVIKGSTT